MTITATDVELPLAVNNIISRSFIERAIPVAPYLTGATPGVVQRGQDTQTVKWRGMDEINPDSNGGTAAPSALGELTGSSAFGMGRSSDNLSDTTVTATLAKYGQYVEISEEVSLFTDEKFLLQVTDVLGEAAGKAVNRLQRDQLEDNLSVRYAGNVASTGVVASAIDLNDIKYTVNQIARANARKFTAMTNGSTNINTTPIMGGYWGFTHEDVAEDIAGLTGFTPVEKYAGHTQTAPHEFGLIRAGTAAVRFISTTEATIDAGLGATGAGSAGLRGTSDNTDVYSTVIIGQGCHGAAAFGRAWRDGIYMVDENLENVDINFAAPQVGPADPFGEVSIASYKLWHKPAILKSSFGYVIQSGASLLT